MDPYRHLTRESIKKIFFFNLLSISYSAYLYLLKWFIYLFIFCQNYTLLLINEEIWFSTFPMTSQINATIYQNAFYEAFMPH